MVFQCFSCALGFRYSGFSLEPSRGATIANICFLVAIVGEQKLGTRIASRTRLIHLLPDSLSCCGVQRAIATEQVQSVTAAVMKAAWPKLSEGE